MDGPPRAFRNNCRQFFPCQGWQASFTLPLMTTIEKIKANPDNPRKVTDKRLGMLQKALQEFGDLGGIIFNRHTKQLVGGHQRIEILKRDPDAKVLIEHRYKKPTSTGTVAEGWVIAQGERFSYREVHWDTVKEKAANLAANKGAGEWDKGKLTGFLHELSNFSLDLDLTMFDPTERIKFFQDGKKERDEGDGGRVSSSEVVTVHLTFTRESSDRFKELIEYWQKLLNIENTTDCVLEVLKFAKDSAR